MKTKNYSILFFSLVLSTAFFSCKQCPDIPQTGNTYNLPDWEKPYVMPYKDYDTIKFLRNNTDSIVLLGNKIISGYNNELDHNSCKHSDKLQWMEQNLYTILNDVIILNYYYIGVTSGYSREYSITFNNELFGSIDAGSIGGNDTIYVHGKLYPYINKIVTSNSIYDTIYYQISTGIIRIKYQNNIYEKVP